MAKVNIGVYVCCMCVCACVCVFVHVCVHVVVAVAVSMSVSVQPPRKKKTNRGAHTGQPRHVCACETGRIVAVCWRPGFVPKSSIKCG